MMKRSMARSWYVVPLQPDPLLARMRTTGARANLDDVRFMMTIGHRAQTGTPPAPPQPAAERARTAECEAHAYAREQGVSRPLYATVRWLAIAALRSWFRVRVSGAEHLPADGPVIVAPNHKNFLDAFFIAIATHRHVRYMAKVELFKGPLGWLFSRLGAFPVRRGEADADALQTARTILEAGGLLVVFPEGTRVEQPDALGSPHHGAGRLAVQTGAPIVPAAISGTSHLWRGALPGLRRVQLTFLEPVAPNAALSADSAATEVIDARVWPAVQDEYGRMRAIPGLIATGLAAIGLGSLVTRRLLRATTTPRLLGKVQPRKLRRRRKREQLLRRLHSHGLH